MDQKNTSGTQPPNPTSITVRGDKTFRASLDVALVLVVQSGSASVYHRLMASS
jgi:hypothetical protein